MRGLTFRFDLEGQPTQFRLIFFSNEINDSKLILGKKRVISGIDSSGAALYTHVRNQDDPRQEQSQESLAERVKRMVAENKGSSISVFINPNDVSRAHFRVDSKFT